MAHLPAHAAGVRTSFPWLRERSRGRRGARRQLSRAVLEATQMMEYSAKPPTIPIPFHKLLKVVALVDAENAEARALIERLETERFEVEVSDRYDRDVLEDAAVGAYIATIDGD